MEQNEDIQAIAKTAVLVVAAFAFSQLTGKCNFTDREGLRQAARDAFDGAEAFMEEAKDRGYDAESIARIAEVAEALPAVISQADAEEVKPNG